MAALPVALAALTWQLSTRMDSVVVRPRAELPSVPVYYYQEDAAWRADRMGDSDRTLGKYGDSVACLASLLAMQGVSVPVRGELNPGTLNAWLTENGGYDGEGNLRWGAVAGLLGLRLTQARPRRGLGAMLERLLKQERYAVVQVRRPDTGRAHDVLVVGSVHGEYLIVDPLDPTDTPNTLGIYDNRVYGARCLT